MSQREIKDAGKGKLESIFEEKIERSQWSSTYLEVTLTGFFMEEMVGIEEKRRAKEFMLCIRTS